MFKDEHGEMRKGLVTPLLITAMLSGCVMGPEYQTPDIALPEALPEHVLLTDEQRHDWSDWWRQFEDPQLDALVERATNESLELRLQLQRIQEARAQLGLSRAEQFPTVALQAEASRERTPGAILPGNGEMEQIRELIESTNNMFSVTGVLEYEVDLWGRLAREREAAEAMLEESAFAHDAARIGIITDVVSTYFDLRSAEAQRRISENTLSVQAETYRLEQLRFDLGATDELALRQAQSELETSRAELPGLRQRVRRLEGALAILVGMSPAELFAEVDFGDSRLEEIALPSGVPTMLPSTLLQRRPDIRAAEAAMIAANARIGAAEASRLPSLNLSAFLGSSAAETTDLFTSSAETWGLGASVAGPLFDFGRSRARIETAEVQAEQADTQYRVTVNTAFNEVRDALVTYDTSGERIEATREQVEAIQRTHELAELRYREGMTSFIEVLDAQRDLHSAQLGLAEAMRDRLTATATLFKALGGGWQDPRELLIQAQEELGDEDHYREAE
ncbi:MULTISPECIES: efflux transporter outer membrane subunit [Halomonadaceae]|uniref:efflux transporter outer membrane subunit n=1 Tax=Halomonadaceae TaxID=28256 RepID=UPI00200D526D|nr:MULTISPECIES: efflux transporter outer membrane subunit [Halomonas]